jgi:hypothetical protein
MKLLQKLKSLSKNPTYLIIAGIVVLFISIVTMTGRAYFTLSYSTDDVAQQVLLQETDLGDGKDVIATAAGYALKFPFYIALNHLLPNTNLTIYLTNLFLLVAGMLLTLVTFLYLRRHLKYSLPVLLILFTTFTIIHISGGAAVNPNYRNIEIGLSFLVVGVALLHLRHGIAKKIAKPVLILGGAFTSVLLGFFWFSDPMFIYYTGLPLGLAALIQYAWLYQNKEQRYRALTVLVVLAASYLAYKGFIPIFDVYFEWRVRPTLGNLIGISELLPTLKKGWSAYVALGAGGDISAFGIVSFSFVRAMAGVLLVSIGIACSGWLFVRELRARRREADIIVLFFAALPFIMLGIFVMSGTIVDSSSMRYLMLLPFTIALTTAITVYYLRAKILTYALIGLATICFSMGMMTAFGTFLSRPAPMPNQVDQDVLQLLKQEGLKKGYAPSGMSLYYNFISDNSINVVSTYCNPQNMGILYLLIDQASIHKTAGRTFFLHYPGTISYRCKVSDVVSKIGKPSRIVDGPGEIKILIYNYDIVGDLRKQKTVK